VKEAILSAKLERTLSKRRILAVYLNVAEWGEGVFGVEAGARHHLGVSAAALRPPRRRWLASMLPAPPGWIWRAPPAGSEAGPGACSTDARRGTPSRRTRPPTPAPEMERILAGPAPADDTGGEEPPEDEAPIETETATATEAPIRTSTEAPSEAPITPTEAPPAAARTETPSRGPLTPTLSPAPRGEGEWR